MTKEEALKLKYGDKVVFTPRGINEDYDLHISRQQEKNGGFLIIMTVYEAGDRPKIKVHTRDSVFYETTVFHDEIELRKEEAIATEQNQPIFYNELKEYKLYYSFYDANKCSNSDFFIKISNGLLKINKQRKIVFLESKYIMNLQFAECNDQQMIFE
jgi:hypothetical protein